MKDLKETWTKILVVKISAEKFEILTKLYVFLIPSENNIHCFLLAVKNKRFQYA